jgi:hypothetical protein
VGVADVQKKVVRPRVLSRALCHVPSNRVWRWCFVRTTVRVTTHLTRPF